MRTLTARARAHLEQWDGVVRPARDAASVLVTRPAPGGLEILLQRRQATMSFASMHVFPGGSVHADDHGPVPWIGAGAGAWAQRWQCDPESAAALVVAAVRETFEETGILLAGADKHSLLGALDTVEWSSVRAALECGDSALGQVLRERGLFLRADRLRAWSHWITPEYEPRRFDTRFFLVVLPPGQSESTHSAEAVESFWIDVAEASRAGEAGELGMVTPTLHNLHELARISRLDVAGVLAAADAREIPTVQPRVVEVEGERYLTSAPDSVDAPRQSRQSRQS